MRVQDRDLRLIRWLNGFGYAGIEEVADWFGVVSVTALIRLNKLVESGLLQRDKVILGGKYYYRPTKLGLQLAGDEMRAVRHIGLGSFLHSLEVVRLATRLERQYANSRFEPERRVRRARGLDGEGVGAGHMPDGLLWLPGADKAIASDSPLRAIK